MDSNQWLAMKQKVLATGNTTCSDGDIIQMFHDTTSAQAKQSEWDERDKHNKHLADQAKIKAIEDEKQSLQAFEESIAETDEEVTPVTTISPWWRKSGK